MHVKKKDTVILCTSAKVSNGPFITEFTETRVGCFLPFLSSFEIRSRWLFFFLTSIKFTVWLSGRYNPLTVTLSSSPFCYVPLSSELNLRNDYHQVLLNGRSLAISSIYPKIMHGRCMLPGARSLVRTSTSMCFLFKPCLL